jgi:hypothetical protein
MDTQWLDGLWPLPAAGLCRLKLGLPAFHHAILPAMLACGLIGWWLNYRRYRLIADTPTARAASAALGHVELYGIAANHDSTVNYSPTPAAAASGTAAGVTTMTARPSAPAVRLIRCPWIVPACCQSRNAAISPLCCRMANRR